MADNQTTSCTLDHPKNWPCPICQPQSTEITDEMRGAVEDALKGELGGLHDSAYWSDGWVDRVCLAVLSHATNRDWWNWANDRATWLADRAGIPHSLRLIWMQACLEIFDCIRRNGGTPK